MSGSPVTSSTAVSALLLADAGAKQATHIAMNQTLNAKNIVVDQQSMSAEVLLAGKWQKVQFTLSEFPKGLAQNALPLSLDKAQLTANAKGELLIQSPQNSVALREKVILLKLLEVGVNKQALGHINTPFSQVSLPANIINKGASPFIEIPQMNAQLALPREHKQMLDGLPSAATLILKIVKGQLSALLSSAQQPPIPVPIDTNKLSQWLAQQPVELKLQPGNSPGQALLSALVPGTATKAPSFTALSQLPLAANIVKQIPAKGMAAQLASTTTGQALIKFTLPALTLGVAENATIVGQKAAPTPTEQTVMQTQSRGSIIAKIVSQIKAWQSPKQVEVAQQVTSQSLHAAKAKALLVPLLPALTNTAAPQWNQWQASNTTPLQQPPLQSVATDTVAQRAPLLAMVKQVQWLTTTTLAPTQTVTTGVISQQLQQPLLNKLSNAVQLTDQLNQLQSKGTTLDAPLRELVNQAFARMIGASQGSQHTALTVQAQLQPWQLSQAQYFSTFNGHIDALNTAVFAQQTANMQGSSHSSFAPLVQVLQLLLGKSANTQNQVQQMQQLQSQLQSSATSALLPELQHITQHTLAQHATPAQSQQDNNPFVQLFVPMKLPPEAGQTQLRISQQASKQTTNEHSTSVWLIEMQFDYPQLGTLSAHAQLGGKTLQCGLKATSSALMQLAQQHTHQLQQKLQEHGLKVAEIEVEQISEQQMALQQQLSAQHSIINIKV